METGDRAVAAKATVNPSDSLNPINQWWIIDSGATHHFIGDPGTFTTSVPHQQPVGLAEGETRSDRIGTVTLMMMLDTPVLIQLKNVLYVPNFNACLLSTRRLSRDHGIGVHITPNDDYLSMEDGTIGYITNIND